MSPLRDDSDDQGVIPYLVGGILAPQYFLSLPRLPLPSCVHASVPPYLLKLVTRAPGGHPWWLGLSFPAACSSFSLRTLLLGHSEPLTHSPGLLVPWLPCSLHSSQYFPLSETDHLLRAPASAPLALGGMRCRTLFPINLGVLEDQRPRVYNLLVIRNPNPLGQSGLYLGPDPLLPASLGYVDKC